MELHGSLAPNLQMALDSSNRLRGHPVHRDTLAFWSDLIGEARARRAAGMEPEDRDVGRLIAELETAIAETNADSNS
jgi:hypothetical protein